LEHCIKYTGESTDHHTSTYARSLMCVWFELFQFLFESIMWLLNRNRSHQTMNIGTFVYYFALLSNSVVSRTKKRDFSIDRTD